MMGTKRQVTGFIGVFAMSWNLFSAPALAQDWTAAPPPDGEVQASFDETLSPYGEWVDADGTRVWRPSAAVVGEDFQPYATNGQWVSSDYGWYFQSDFSWGWAPFHYGRWAMDPNYGWIWVPGTVWAPAWVDWRSGGGYIGWAPLPPIGWSVVVQPWRPYWCFVPVAHFSGNFWAHRLPVEHIHYAYAATAPVHQAVSYSGARWYAGPPVSQVERVTAQPIQRVAGSFTPPAPGRIQPVQLQPPRGYAGNPGAVRPAAVRQSVPPPSHPPPPSRPAPAPAPTSTGHSAPHGAYSPQPPAAPASEGTRVAAESGWSGNHPAAGGGWSGTVAHGAWAPAGSPTAVPVSPGFASSSHGHPAPGIHGMGGRR